jgi:hypothetical protein
MQKITMNQKKGKKRLFLAPVLFGVSLLKGIPQLLQLPRLCCSSSKGFIDWQNKQVIIFFDIINDSLIDDKVEVSAMEAVKGAK